MSKPSHLIINNPYFEPDRHWKYDPQKQSFELEPGRRPAGYVVAADAGPNDPGRFVPIELPNLIRGRVKAWRESGYPGVTATTRTLLEHWRDDDQRPVDKRFFFAQLEAIETLIWLNEAPAADRVGIEIPGDGGPFRRLCSKMATGTGKTIVMAMIIAWQVLNKAANNQDTRFSKNVLVLAPGLTVKNRLDVLKPSQPDSYFDLFRIVPDSLMQAMRAHGRIHIINWHKLAWESEEKVAKKKGVDKRGARSDEAWLRDVLDDMRKARNLVVLNDEAHHAWRVQGSTRGIDRNEKETATVWISGLDRIHKARGILTCFDLSATPFAPSAQRGDKDELLFGWIVSDFGLNDAIESGLVKTPRVVIRDDAIPDAKTYRAKLHHIYEATDEHGNRIKDDLNRKAEPHEPLPQLVISAYALLGKDWLEKKEAWEKAGSPVPPAMISVVNRIETAARIKHAIDHNGIPLPELCDASRTLQIDSDTLGKAEAQDDAISLAQGGGGDRDDDDGSSRKLTKNEQAELLRRMVDTVGKVGEPGADLQHVISVAMLSEGWDAKTVTHIMGLRAFTSQLLCEQVIGRGLRRTTYELEKEGFGLPEPEPAKKGKGKKAPSPARPIGFQFKPEYVNVFGVPFSFLPHEEAGEGGDPPAKPAIRVEPIPEREAAFGISWPQVVRIEHVLAPRLSVHWSEVKPLEIDAAHVPLLAELAPTVDGHADVERIEAVDLRDLADRYRLQKMVFETARQVFEDARPDWRGNDDVLLGQLIGIVNRFLTSDRIRIQPDLYANEDRHRRVLLALSMTPIVQRVRQAIHQQNTEYTKLVLDEHQPIRSTADLRAWYTSRPCQPTKRSHVNHCVHDSTWEATAAFHLEKRDDLVAAWVKNEHLGFEIRYIHAGGVRRYRPDYLIRLTNGVNLILEVKGEGSEKVEAAGQAAGEWATAVTEDGRFGRWVYAIAYSPSEVLDVLAAQTAPQAKR